MRELQTLLRCCKEGGPDVKKTTKVLSYLWVRGADAIISEGGHRHLGLRVAGQGGLSPAHTGKDPVTVGPPAVVGWAPAWSGLKQR